MSIEDLLEGRKKKREILQKEDNHSTSEKNNRALYRDCSKKVERIATTYRITKFEIENLQKLSKKYKTSVNDLVRIGIANLKNLDLLSEHEEFLRVNEQYKREKIRLEKII